MLFFLDIFLKLYMYNSVIVVYSRQTRCKVVLMAAFGGFKGTYIYFSFFFSLLAPCELQVAVASCYLLLVTCDLWVPTCYLRLRSCHLLIATCDLLLATCHLLLADCQLLLASCYIRFFFFEEFVRRILKGSPLTNTLSKMCLYMSLKCVLLSILLRATERKLETFWHVNSTCCIRALLSIWRVCKNFLC